MVVTPGKANEGVDKYLICANLLEIRSSPPVHVKLRKQAFQESAAG